MILSGGQWRKETSYLCLPGGVQIGDMEEKDAGDENVAQEKGL